MNIVGTAILLIVTLLVVPVISYFTGTSLGPVETAALHSVLMILLAAWVLCFTLGELTLSLIHISEPTRRATISRMPSSA